jgi:hypothetical protein
MIDTPVKRFVTLNKRPSPSECDKTQVCASVPKSCSRLSDRPQLTCMVMVVRLWREMLCFVSKYTFVTTWVGRPCGGKMLACPTLCDYEVSMCQAGDENVFPPFLLVSLPGLLHFVRTMFNTLHVFEDYQHNIQVTQSSIQSSIHGWRWSMSHTLQGKFRSDISSVNPL